MAWFRHSRALRSAGDERRAFLHRQNARLVPSGVIGRMLLQVSETGQYLGSEVFRRFADVLLMAPFASGLSCLQVLDQMPPLWLLQSLRRAQEHRWETMGLSASRLLFNDLFTSQWVTGVLKE
jgi:hypothetical protein